MSDESIDRSLRGRLTSGTEETLGKLAQELLENPIVSGAIARAFDAREKASHAQEAAMGALNLPSAADIERLTRRLRSVSQRLEGIEDGVDRLGVALMELSTDKDVSARLTAIEEQLAVLARTLADVAEQLPGTRPPVSLAQERLAVEAAQTVPARAPAKPRRARTARKPA